MYLPGYGSTVRADALCEIFLQKPYQGSMTDLEMTQLISSLLEHVTSQPENPFSKLISGQKIVRIPSFTLESGVTLTDVSVAYKTSGVLNDSRDNAMVICHALTGSADVWDWWGPLVGPGRAFDTGRFFVVCCNSLGSPYGSASPCTEDPATGRIYGPEFPLTTVRDDVKLVACLWD